MHRRACQIFYVLHGALVLEVNGERRSLSSGDSLVIPPGAWHAVHNDAAGPASFLLIASPSAAGDREEAPASP